MAGELDAVPGARRQSCPLRARGRVLKANVLTGVCLCAFVPRKKQMTRQGSTTEAETS